MGKYPDSSLTPKVSQAKGPSLESIQEKANNILGRCEQLSGSLSWLANASPTDVGSMKADDSPKDTNIHRIDSVLNSILSTVTDMENNLSKLRYG